MKNLTPLRKLSETESSLTTPEEIKTVLRKQGVKDYKMLTMWRNTNTHIHFDI